MQPSDTANAVVALDGSMVIRSAKGERVVPASEFFVGPALNIRRMTVLEPGEILTAVRIPSTWAGAKFYFEKIADRAAWDFALVSIAAAFKMDGDRISDSRLVVGAVECVPHRLTAVESAIKGSAKNEETGTRAGKLAIEGATTLNFNQFKIPLMENLVRRAIRGA